MTKKNTKKSRRSGESWRNIDQGSARAVTSEAQKRRWMLLFKGGLLVAALTIPFGLIGLGVIMIKHDRLPRCMSCCMDEIENVEFETDGVLTQKHIDPALERDANGGLLTVDLFGLKEQLESIGQVKSVIVERQFPSTLKITLEEYRPMMRMIALDEQGKRMGLLVSEEGEVFRGYGFDKRVLRGLPYISGFSLRLREDDSYFPISNIGHVSELIETASVEAPSIYRQWKLISMEYVNDYPAYGSFIKVRTRGGLDIVFGLEDFPMQLKRLGAILSYANNEKLRTIERIDLSMNNQAAVKLVGSMR